MKRFCYPLVLFFILIFPQVALSDNGVECFNSIISFSPVKDNPGRNEKDYPSRPKAPTRQMIFCVYGDGELHFEFLMPEGRCSLVVANLDSGMTRTYTFDSESEVDVFVGSLSRATLYLSTAKGNAYYGEIGQ